MKRNLFPLLSAVLLLGACAPAPQHHLTILHVNDTHSHFEPVRSGEQAGLGGIQERAAFVDSVRRADGPENVLLLHAGDFSQGTTYFSELGGNLEITCINAMGYDVVTLGNHEFDNGVEDLARRLSGLNCPVVCCNYDFSPFECGRYIKPYAVVEKAGLRIGVLGVLCDIRSMVSAEISSRIPEMDTVEAVQQCADRLRNEEHCDLVIALTHIGYEVSDPLAITDPILASKTRGIDLIVGGHSHTFLEEIAYADNLDGKAVPIVQDGCWGIYHGQIHVEM